MCRGSTDQEEDTGGPIVTLVLGITSGGAWYCVATEICYTAGGEWGYCVKTTSLLYFNCRN